MVESFPGRNSQQIRPFLPPYQGGGYLSRSVFSLSPGCCDNPHRAISAPFTYANVERTSSQGERCRLCIGFRHFQRYGLIRKPNLICEQNTVDLRSFGQ